MESEADPGASTTLADAEAQLGQICREFVTKLVALRGEVLRGGSGLKSDLGPKLDAPSNAPPGVVFAKVVELLSTSKGRRILDFGCGNGPHRALIQKHGFTWIGCDWEGSVDPESVARRGSSLDGHVVKYDGSLLPFEDEYFDAIWSWQSMEHVQNPESALGEISRCLRKGGVFAGSTSFLEPYHAQSTFGFSPWGFHLLCARHSITVVNIQPADDALSLLVKKLALMLSIGRSGRHIHDALRKADIMAPLESCFAAGSSSDLSSVFGQICGTFRFVSRKSQT